MKEKLLVPWLLELSGFSISPSSRLLKACPCHARGLKPAAAHPYLLSPPCSAFCKSQAKQTCKPKHTPSQITSGVWVAPPHAELCGFSSNTSSHAVSCCSTVTAGKGNILHFPTFPSLWILWSGAFFLLYMLVLEKLSQLFHLCS